MCICLTTTTYLLPIRKKKNHDSPGTERKRHINIWAAWLQDRKREETSIFFFVLFCVMYKAFNPTHIPHLMLSSPFS